MEKDGPIVIENPIKPWWPGDPRVEEFMPKVSEAIRRHIKWPSDEFTDIYNRAYEAVYSAILKYDGSLRQKEGRKRHPKNQKKGK